MSRRKKPENETIEEARIRQQMEVISDKVTRNEKVSWERKMDNMVKLIAKIRPIEDKISELILEKQPLFDEIQSLRADMVKDCIHPPTQLVHNTTPELGEYIECKFCYRRFAVQKD